MVELEELEKVVNLREPQVKNLQVVRLVTDHYMSSGGACMKKTLRPQKRLSSGYQLLDEDMGWHGCKHVLSFLDFTQEDGLYVVKICEVSRCWETGHVDDYEYCLEPYEESL